MSAGGPEPPQPERHEPLPGVLGLPGYLYRRTPAHWRVAGALALAALLVGAVVAVPLVQDSKREREAREREQQRRNLARRRSQIIAQQQPHYRRAPNPGQTATLRALDRSIVADVSRRVRSGEVDTPAARSDCIIKANKRFDGKVEVGCTAVTSDIEAGEFSSAASVGYIYRALVDPRTGMFAFCKVIGRPGEGSFTRRGPPPLSPDCG